MSITCTSNNLPGNLFFRITLNINTYGKIHLNKTDTLAIERTRLANERTFLAYFRTAIVFLSSGFAIIKINALKDITFIGYIFMVIAPVLFLIGLLRFLYVRQKLQKYYYHEN